MARPYFKAEHVREFKDLPAKPVKGRAYFIDDEGCIAVDYGDTRGVQLYGNKIGIQGSTGELVLQMRANIQDLFEKLIPLLQDIQENEPSTQEQIDALSFANIQNSINSIKAHERRKSEIKNEAAIRAEEDAKLKTQISEINENIKSESLLEFLLEIEKLREFYGLQRPFLISRNRDLRESLKSSGFKILGKFSKVLENINDELTIVKVMSKACENSFHYVELKRKILEHNKAILFVLSGDCEDELEELKDITGYSVYLSSNDNKLPLSLKIAIMLDRILGKR